MTTTNDGQVSYSILKAASVIVAIGAAILAIVVWSAEAESTIGVDAFGQFSVTEPSGAVKVITGFAILIGGLVQAALFWAVGSMGEHLIRIRSVVEPAGGSAVRTESNSAASNSETASNGAHKLWITDAGPNPEKVTRALVESFDVVWQTAEQATRGELSLSGSYATVEGAAIAIRSAGGQAATAESA